MTETVTGFVSKVSTKSGTNARGTWTAYSLKITSKEGVEDPRWFQYGFEKPACNEGDYVQLKATPKDDKSATVEKGSVKVSTKPPAKPAAPAAKSAVGGSRAATVKTSELFGEIGGYNTEDDIKRMSLSAARTAAIETVGLMLSVAGLPLTGAKTKAGEAARFAEILATINKLTVQYFYDAASGRILDTVQDAGIVDVTADGALPEGDILTDDDGFDSISEEEAFE